jgi:REP element-mobilizing transposase RayT
MAFWRLYYHLAWATKNRFDLISDEIEERLFSNIISKSNSMECQVHAKRNSPGRTVMALFPWAANNSTPRSIMS